MREQDFGITFQTRSKNAENLITFKDTAGTELQMQLLQARFQKLNACSPYSVKYQKLVKNFSWGIAGGGGSRF